MRRSLALLFALFVLLAQPTKATAPEPRIIYTADMFKPVEVPEKVTPTPTPTPIIKKPLPSKAPIHLTIAPKHRYTWDNEVSWYGPGFYGNRTACGLALTKDLKGVAHRTLPCGTKVTFRYNGVEITVPVVDRGPYVNGRQWDLTGGLCVYLSHCFTGPIEFEIIK